MSTGRTITTVHFTDDTGGLAGEVQTLGRITEPSGLETNTAHVMRTSVEHINIDEQ